MKVLLLTHEFPPHRMGGMATYCDALAGALVRCGMEVTVVAGSPSSFIKSNLAEMASGTNPRIIRVTTIDLPPAHLWYQLMNLSVLQKLVSKSDIVHGQDASSFPLIYLSKRKNPEVPWVVTLHTGPISELYCALRSLGRGGSGGDFLKNGVGFPAWDVMYRGDMRFADAIISISENLSMETQKHFGVDPKKLFTIYPGVDIDRLESIARRSRLNCLGSDKIRLFWGGRFTWRKGILQLVDALSYLVNEIGFSSLELEMFGRGPLERRVRELASRSGLEDKIRLRGFVPYEELIASMASSDIVCFPSLYEACPSGMMEAMSLGKPILAFDAPFSREILGDHYPMPLAASTIDYARCLHLLCTSKELRRECQVYLRPRAREHFDMRAVAEKYSDIYERVLLEKTKS